MTTSWYRPRQNELTAVAAANGTATVRTVEVPEGHSWRIDMLVVVTTSALAGEALVYLGDPAPETFVCGTQAGNNDTADGAAIVLVEGEWLSISWSGQSPGATCTARLHLEDLVQSRAVVDRTPVSLSR